MGESDFDARMERLANLLEEVEATCSPAQAAPARELMRAVLDVHQSGLSLLLDATRSWLEERGGAHGWLEALSQNPAVASLLLMHDLHPEALEARAERILAETQGAEGSEAAFMLANVEGTTLHLRALKGEPRALERLARTLEQRLCEAAPEALVRFEGLNAPAAEGLIPVDQLKRRRAKNAEASALPALPEGEGGVSSP